MPFQAVRILSSSPGGTRLARAGWHRRAERLFERGIDARVGLPSTPIDAWIDLRIAMERLRMGNVSRAEASRRIDQVMRAFETYEMVGHQSWLVAARSDFGL